MNRPTYFAISAALALLITASAFADAAEVENEHAIPESQMPEYIVLAVNSPSRPAADRELDSSRKPEQILALKGDAARGKELFGLLKNRVPAAIKVNPELGHA